MTTQCTVSALDFSTAGSTPDRESWLGLVESVAPGVGGEGGEISTADATPARVIRASTMAGSANRRENPRRWRRGFMVRTAPKRR